MKAKKEKVRKCLSYGRGYTEAGCRLDTAGYSLVTNCGGFGVVTGCKIGGINNKEDDNGI